ALEPTDVSRVRQSGAPVRSLGGGPFLPSALAGNGSQPGGRFRFETTPPRRGVAELDLPLSDFAIASELLKPCISRPQRSSMPSPVCENATAAPSNLDTSAVKQLFRKHFGYLPARTVRAPGRLEVLGNHTDYNEGLVLSVAVDKYLCIAASPRTDGKVELVSSAFPGRELFWISELKHNPAAAWAD